MFSITGEKNMFTRRSFLKSMSAAGAVSLTTVSFSEKGMARALDATRYVAGRTPDDVARDEDFWFEVQQAFTVDRSLINLNNGGVSPSPRIVQDAMRRYLEFSNQAPVYTMWQVLEPQIEGVRRRLAAAFGCDPEEMAITRNASEALEICQLGLNLKPGDEVLTTNQDYPRMLTTWRQRVRRDGIKLNQISFPVPPKNWDDLAQAFERAITPRTRVIHFCHITNLTGQIFPVKRICQMGRERGIEVIVDGAHAFAHFPFTQADLDCDYYGTSLHKWLLAPHGTGFLYVRKSKIKNLWALMASEERNDDNIRKFEEIGTHPAANHNAIAEALTFHEGIGAKRKAERLRYLFHRWAKRLDGQPGVRLLTSYDPQQSCGLANVSLTGIDPGKLASYLFTQSRIIVTPIKHQEFEGLRVTPNVYTTLSEVDTFSEAIERVIQKGLPS
jgi:selenocysteine lyase/cysteine desulfurase